MEQTDQLILDTAYRLLSDHCGAEVVNQAETGVQAERLQNAIWDAGLPLAWVPEEAGGVGGSLALGFNLIRQAAGFAVPVPLVDTMVANLVLAHSGLEVVETCAVLLFDGGELPVLDGGVVNGLIEHAPGAPAESLLVVPVMDGDGVRVATFTADHLTVERRESLAGEPRIRAILDAASPLALSPIVDGMTKDGLWQFGALVRASQIAGAMEKINDITVNYVKERHQFGRPLGKFQAIQHKVADIAGESALANAAVEQGVRMLSRAGKPFAGDRVVFLPAATAKVVTSEGVAVVSRLAHQCHGAMGFSFEYPLQQYSRRLWAWREEYGSEFYWSERIGMSVASEIDGTSMLGGQVWDCVSR